MANSLNAEASHIAATIGTLVREALPDGGKVAVAYSGGTDSTVLLALARKALPKQSGIELSALHVNHQLQDQADAWQRHCQRRCAGWKVPLEVTVVKPEAKGNLEDKARKLRHQAMARTDAEAILLAHHADDQAETVMLRVLRGAGVRGLGAMKPISRLPGSAKLLLRPLLEVTRCDLQKAARQLRVRGISDPSNKDRRLNRNWLRHSFIPKANERFPGATHSLLAIAKNADKASSLLGQLAMIDHLEATTERGLSRDKLAQLGKERVARKWHRPISLFNL